MVVVNTFVDFTVSSSFLLNTKITKNRLNASKSCRSLYLHLKRKEPGIIKLHHEGTVRLK